MENNMDFINVYENSFSDPNYNLHPNTEFRFQLVYEFIKKNKVESMIDIGSGRGNVIDYILTNHPNINITSCDLKKFHDFDVDFIQINLCDNENVKIDNKYDLLTCLDVLEHLEKTCVDNVLRLFSNISKHSLITIANHSDIKNGVELHIIQENMGYWSPIIEKYFQINNVDTKYDGRLYLLELTSKNYTI